MSHAECDNGLSRREGDSVDNEDLENAVRTILMNIGEDTQREGLLKTPARVSKALRFLTSGYKLSLDAVVNDAIFHTGHHEMVIVKDIDISSLCEHHLLPFNGKIHIAYVPQGRVLGLSKIARIVEVYARRLQIQERLTRQVAEGIQQVLEPSGVAVMLKCSHMCMAMRGVRQANATTVTRCETGEFLNDPVLKQDFCNMVGM